ncbi:MAG: hypothetical protein ABR607_10750 [Pyrinomonadaceae bacterium]
MDNNRNRLVTGWALALVTLVSVAAQTDNVGTLNAWTIKPVTRIHAPVTENPHIRTVRAAKQNNFDRVVFEFEGAIPNFRIEYLKSRIYESTAGRERLRLPGNVFLKINFFVITADERQMQLSKAKNFVPRGRLRMPAVQSVKDKEFFEGYYDFLMGLSSRKPYRVTELSNPFRLVIDFKH